METISTKPASGTRDFLPAQIAARRVVMNTIQRVYECYGFAPIETPAMERVEVLTGKYGNEGENLIFKVMKRGEKLPALRPDTPIASLSDMALRYDLTVPLARVVAEHNASLPRFFKRYQIQTVWRADRPQRGRFREFYQCDIDYTGTSSIVAETTVITAVCDVLGQLGFSDFTVRVNDRRVLTGLMDIANISLDLQSSVLATIDKLDKIGIGGLERELALLGLESAQISTLKATFSDDSSELLNSLRSIFAGRSASGAEGCECLISLFSLLENTGLPAGRVAFDPSLARGLSYYTGPIFEIQVTDLAGSLGGGGRYDGLIGMFNGTQIPAVGFSLGLERILVVMEERGMLAPASAAVDLMIAIADVTALPSALRFAAIIRAAGIRTDIYPEAAKLGKQLSHAQSIGVRYVAILGEREIETGVVTLKDLTTGAQQAVAPEACISILSSCVDKCLIGA